MISALATVPQKRELFAKHAAHLNALAAEVERAMAAANKEASATAPKRLGSTELIQHATERRVLPVLHLDPAIGPAIRP